MKKITFFYLLPSIISIAFAFQQGREKEALKKELNKKTNEIKAFAKFAEEQEIIINKLLDYKSDTKKGKKQ